MRKKLGMLLAIFTIIIVVSTVFTRYTMQPYKEQENNETVIVTSFYPMYILTSNITKDIQGVRVVNLTSNQTGCLHDYQLTTEDMKKLSNADIFIMNGGGMESYIEDVIQAYPKVRIVNTSEHITMLPAANHHSHDEEHVGEAVNNREGKVPKEIGHIHEEHNHGEYNAHVWLNMDDYLQQIEQVKSNLMKYDNANKVKYEENAEIYTKKVMELKERYGREIEKPVNREIIIFHDAFAYLADQIGLDVVYTIEMDSEISLSAGDIKEVVDEVNHHDIRVLFTEEQYFDTVAASIAKETNAKVFNIDTLVTGDDSLDAYLNGMEANLEVLKEALFE